MIDMAFPAHWNMFPPQTGMTLRDYFAAKAMQGFIQYFATKGMYTPSDDDLAKSSYDIADAMLKARDK